MLRLQEFKRSRRRLALVLRSSSKAALFAVTFFLFTFLTFSTTSSFSLFRHHHSPSTTAIAAKKKVYLFYQDGESYHDTNFTCPIPWKWTETIEEADVVIHNILDDDPFNEIDDRPIFIERPAQKPNQLYAFMSLESGIIYPHMYKENKERFGYNISIDYRVWPDHPQGPADIPAVYITNPSAPDFELDFRKPPNLPKRKDAIMAAFISHCEMFNGRDEILKTLMQYIPVHSYGLCENNIKEPKEYKKMHGAKVKQLLASQYYFLYAPENTNDPGYVTEKVYDAIAAGTVPVYFGAPDINRFVPNASAVINVADFQSTEALATHLKELAADEEKYSKTFEWKKEEFNEDFKRVLRLACRTVQCRLAMKLEGLDFEEDLKGVELFKPE